MTAKMVLPLLGGSPAVWNTSLFFFQTTLLLGYGYSYLSTTWLGRRSQSIIHVFVLLLPLAFLPLTLHQDWSPLNASRPIPWLLTILVLSVSFPFFAVSTSSSLLQKWFANTTHPLSNDPYFLYTASNLGSLLGVISYPIFIEPNLSLTRQNWLWAVGYVLLMLLTFGCTIIGQLKAKEQVLEEAEDSLIPPPTSGEKVQWILLSFLPSSLLLGVTTYLTTDLAAIPLLWAIPLALYLLTFIFTFSRNPILPQKNLEKVLPLLLASLIFLSLLKVIQPVWLLLPLHLLGLFGIAGTLHGKLAQSRPNTKYLTSFYFWMSLGGVLGGLFNAIVAPLLFANVLEYPLILSLSLVLLGIPSAEEVQEKALKERKINEEILATLVKEGEIPKNTFNSAKFQIPLILVTSIIFLICALLTGFQIKYLQDNLPGILFTFGLLIVIRYAFKLNLTRFIVSLILLILISQFYIPSLGQLLTSERSFFGVNRVVSNGSYHSLLHGTTLHGKQSLDTERRSEPLTYFYPTGPIGQVFQSLYNSQHLSHIGVMGLGIGTLVSYAKPEQNWTFYEIDPIVQKLASNPAYFTFLQDAKAPVSIVLGDARLSLQKAADNYYDLLIMDAFSSDSIPTHLVTLEALQLYLTKLNKEGLLAINISNRHINLAPVISSLADKLNLSTLQQLDIDISPAEKLLGKKASQWVLLSPNKSNLSNLLADNSHWQKIPQDPNFRIWTDDFSNIFGVLRIFNANYTE